MQQNIPFTSTRSNILWILKKKKKKKDLIFCGPHTIANNSLSNMQGFLSSKIYIYILN